MPWPPCLPPCPTQVPHVAGWAALYLEHHPNASPVEVKAVLQAAATRGAVSLPASVLPGTPTSLLYVGQDGLGAQAAGGAPPPTAAAYAEAGK